MLPQKSPRIVLFPFVHKQFTHSSTTFGLHLVCGSLPNKCGNLSPRLSIQNLMKHYGRVGNECHNYSRLTKMILSKRPTSMNVTNK